jgi:hypothetical protein
MVGQQGHHNVGVRDGLPPGGAWRYVLRKPNGKEYGFRGTFVEIVPPEWFSWMFGVDGMPGEGLEVYRFTEHDGKTTLTTTSHFPSVEVRDAVIASGMETGAAELFDRLEDTSGRCGSVKFEVHTSKFESSQKRERSEQRALLRLDRLQVAHEILNAQGLDARAVRHRVKHGSPDRHVEIAVSRRRPFPFPGSSVGPPPGCMFPPCLAASCVRSAGATLSAGAAGPFPVPVRP